MTNLKTIFDKSLHQKTQIALKSYGSHTAGILMETFPNVTATGKPGLLQSMGWWNQTRLRECTELN